MERQKFAEPSYFEDLQIGQTFYIPSRTQTDALFAAFQLVSADNHHCITISNTAKSGGSMACWRTGFKLWCKPPPGPVTCRIYWAMP